MFIEKSIYKIGFIGSGKLATQLAMALYDKGIDVAQIYSRNFQNASILADRVKAEAIEKISDFSESTDIVIVSISDSAYSTIDLSVIKKDIIIVHTSGSLSIDVLKSRINCGVFYPLQTFNKYDIPDWNKIPICIEADSLENSQKIKNLASLLSKNIYDINSVQRASLHLAAVFVCNFTNSMYAIGEELLDEKEISLNLLRPLIEETAKNAIKNSPKYIQTGPAVRNDKPILEKQIESLKHHKDYAEIYKLITKIIQKQQKSITKRS